MNVFVFGSNRAGRHGKGAALFARKHHGAIYGVGEGRQNNSYGIPTKDHNIRTLSLTEIEKHVKTFIQYAREHKNETFEVTEIGCGLAGYTPENIAPLFKGASSNVRLPKSFSDILIRQWREENE